MFEEELKQRIELYKDWEQESIKDALIDAAGEVARYISSKEKFLLTAGPIILFLDNESNKDDIALLNDYFKFLFLKERIKTDYLKDVLEQYNEKYYSKVQSIIRDYHSYAVTDSEVGTSFLKNVYLKILNFVVLCFLLRKNICEKHVSLFNDVVGIDVNPSLLCKGVSLNIDKQIDSAECADEQRIETRNIKYLVIDNKVFIDMYEPDIEFKGFFSKKEDAIKCVSSTLESFGYLYHKIDDCHYYTDLIREKIGEQSHIHCISIEEIDEDKYKRFIAFSSLKRFKNDNFCAIETIDNKSSFNTEDEFVSACKAQFKPGYLSVYSKTKVLAYDPIKSIRLFDLKSQSKNNSGYKFEIANPYKLDMFEANFYHKKKHISVNIPIVKNVEELKRICPQLIVDNWPDDRDYYPFFAIDDDAKFDDLVEDVMGYFEASADENFVNSWFARNFNESDNSSDLKYYVSTCGDAFEIEIAKLSGLEIENFTSEFFVSDNGKFFFVFGNELYVAIIPY